MFGPVIEGVRVRLEPPRRESSELFRRWFADMRVTRYLMHRHPPSPHQVDGRWLDVWLGEIHREDWERTREAACTAR